MPIKGAQEAKHSISRKIDALANDKMERALTTIAYSVLGHSGFYVPIDTSNLMNSGRVEVRKTSAGWHASVSYRAEYVKYLHEGIGWQPKPSGTPGKKTGGYNPNAKPGWLNIGADEAWPKAKVTFRRIVKL